MSPPDPMHRHVLKLYLSLTFVSLSLVAAVLLLRESQRSMAQLQNLHLARATCQSLYYAIARAETVRYEGDGPICTLTLDDGRTLRARWQDAWWVWEKRI